MNIQNPRDFDLESQDNSFRQYHYEFDTFTRTKLLNAFEPHMAKKGKTLEVGAYKGAMTSMLSRLFVDLTVIEASTDLSEGLASSFPNVKVINDLVENWETADRFDNVFLIHTLEHITNRIEVLRKLGALLTSSGKLFVAVPNATALSRLIAVEMGLLDRPEAITEGERLHGHTITYTSETLSQEAKEAGLSIVATGGVVLKPLANFQIDAAMTSGIISAEFLDACDSLARSYPELSASIFLILGANA